MATCFLLFCPLDLRRGVIQVSSSVSHALPFDGFHIDFSIALGL